MLSSSSSSKKWTYLCLPACIPANFCLRHSFLLPPRRASRALTTARTSNRDNQIFIVTSEYYCQSVRTTSIYTHRPTRSCVVNPDHAGLFWGNCLHPEALGGLPDVLSAFSLIRVLVFALWLFRPLFTNFAVCIFLMTGNIHMFLSSNHSFINTYFFHFEHYVINTVYSYFVTPSFW